MRRRGVAANQPEGCGRAHIRPVMRSPVGWTYPPIGGYGPAQAWHTRSRPPPRGASAMTDHAEKARRFLALHRDEHLLLLPNPWDRGSAMLLASLGFQALATTSSGYAATLGRLDGSVARDEAVGHAASIVQATDLPVWAENYLHGRPDLDDTISRLQAYQAAGADVLYAPGLSRLEDIRDLVASVDRPVNVLARPGAPAVSELAAVGVRRVSVGGAFAFAALGAVIEAARELREEGTYTFWERASIGLQGAR